MVHRIMWMGGKLWNTHPPFCGLGEAILCQKSNCNALFMLQLSTFFLWRSLWWFNRPLPFFPLPARRLSWLCNPILLTHLLVQHQKGEKKKSLSSTPLRYTAYTDRGKYWPSWPLVSVGPCEWFPPVHLDGGAPSITVRCYWFIIQLAVNQTSPARYYENPI